MRSGHEAWAEAAGAYVLGALPDDERAAYEAHLRECPLCRAAVAELMPAVAALPAALLSDRLRGAATFGGPMATCYRHPNRETGVSCSSCGRPICPDCMTPTPVGMRCPECSRQRTRTRTLRSMAVEPRVTYALIAVNVLLFLAELGTGGGTSRLITDLATLGVGIDRSGPVGVAEGEWWRLVTGAFLHAPTNPLHIGFNMYLLYVLGRMLEPALGHVRFGALYVAAMLAGSFGALIAEPTTLTIGASGAVFGLMGAAFAMEHARGVNPRQSGILPLIVLNLALGFFIPHVAIGGHIGGLIGGGIAGLAMDRLAARRRGLALPVGVCVAVAAISVVGAIAVSDSKAESLGIAATVLGLAP